MSNWQVKNNVVFTLETPTAAQPLAGEACPAPG